MSSLTLHLHSATQREEIHDIRSFVAEDDTGSFGLMAGHEKFMTALIFGLAKFQRDDGTWEYLALPGGLLYGDGRDVYVNTRHYLRNTDYAAISEALEEELVREEQELASIKDSLKEMEEQMLKRLWDLRRREPH